MAARNRSLPLLLLLIAVFVLGLYALFSLRFSGGDLFPPYSTLRADPLGGKALYAALDRLAGVDVSRNYLPLARLDRTTPATLLLLGADPDTLLCPYGQDLRRELEGLAAAGFRVIVAFASPEEKAAVPPPRSDEKKESPPNKNPPSQPQEDDPGWGVAFDTPPPSTDPLPTAAVLNPQLSGLPRELPLHSQRLFSGMDPAWRAIYRAGKGGVVVERSFGEGSVVLLAESYLLSNEAMRADRHPGFLAWLIGPHNRILFDERHLGLAEQTGVIGLVRSLQLHWFLLGLLAIAALLTWQQALPLVPPREELSAGDAPPGQDQFCGLVHLLRRHVAQAELLPACVREWRRSAPPQLLRRLGRVEEILKRRQDLPKRHRNLVRDYKEIAHSLSERKPHDR